MSDIFFNADALELNATEKEMPNLVFIDDASYEFVGGGDAYNGY